ncbi:MAG TPA: carbon-nitrogen family hydrolase [Actinomycetales bacterium]|nr:carbon-nitrogen family hydrolase [Actinomycetales bacterium]
MRLAVLQLSYGDDEPIDARRERVAAMVRDQRGADLVVLPELWAPGGFAYRGWPTRAEGLDGPTVTAIAEAAADIEAVVHAGSVIERAPAGPDGRGLWNTSVLLGPDGSVLATYRKVHRFGFGQGEPSLLEAGTEVVTVPLPGTDVVAGLATCYDLRFPEMFRALLDAGSELVLVPAAWPAARVGHWTLLGRARALENQCLLVAANTAGTHSGHAMGGRSQVVSPDGEVLAEAGDGEETLVLDVDLGLVARAREAFPVLADRRLR